MKRIWWPDPAYEAKPYGAMTAGLLVASVAVLRAWALGAWDGTFVAAMLFGLGAAVYGAYILRLRFAYRGRSRWNVERRL
jgi:hypothetical protein